MQHQSGDLCFYFLLVLVGQCLSFAGAESRQYGSSRSGRRPRRAISPNWLAKPAVLTLAIQNFLPVPLKKKRQLRHQYQAAKQQTNGRPLDPSPLPTLWMPTPKYPIMQLDPTKVLVGTPDAAAIGRASASRRSIVDWYYSAWPRLG